MTCNTVESSCFQFDLVFFSISKLQYRSSNSYFNLLLLLSGDISLNPGPLHNNQLQPQNEWSVFNSRGLHSIHLSVNSLLPKIDKLRNIAKLSNAAVIGISESKLDDIRNDLRFDVKLFFCLKLETFSSKYYYQIRNQ